MYNYLKNNNVVILTSLILLVVCLVFGLTYTTGNEQKNTQEPSIETFDVNSSIGGSSITVNTINPKHIGVETENLGTSLTISNPGGSYLNISAIYTAEENTITQNKVISLSSSQTSYSGELMGFLDINVTDTEGFNLGGSGSGVANPGNDENLPFDLDVNASLHDTLSDAQNKQNAVDSDVINLSTGYSVNDTDAHRLRVLPVSEPVAAFRPSSSSYDFTSRPNSTRGINVSETGSLPGIDTFPLGHGQINYTLAVNGIDEVAYGEFPSYADNIRAIESWGNENYTDLGGAYERTSNFEHYNATDAPDLSSVSNLSEMFKKSNISASTSNLNNWNTSTITDMSEMFKGASKFNGNVTEWNVSNISTASGMAGMFDGATSFSQDLSDWCVSDIKSEPSNFAPSLTIDDKPQFRQTCFEDTGLVIRINHSITNSVSTGTGEFKIITNPQIRRQVGYDYSVKARAVDGTSIVDFGSSINGDITLNFPTGPNEPDLYDIQINGVFPSMFFPITLSGGFNPAAQSEAVKIKSIEKWGKSQAMLNVSQMFAGAVNLEYYNATNPPQLDTSLGAVNASSMFQNADNFNGQIGNWDNQVSKVGDMRGMFLNASSFNDDISNWQTRNVQHMSSMFRGATRFNQDISSWDTSNVQDMSGMFSRASSFSQDISRWCVSQIPSKPTDFDFNAGFDGQPSLQPDWGTSNGC